MEDDRMEGNQPEIPESSADVNWFHRSSLNASTAIGRQESADFKDGIHRVIYDKHGDYYDMTGKKYLLIFNHYKYQSTKYFNYQKYSVRDGTYNDVKSLHETFENLGFEVTPHHDFEYEQIMDSLSELINADHKQTSCVAVVILSHGESRGLVCAADRPYELSDVTAMLQQATSLAGKPKLVFVQACRGKKVDDGCRIKVDAEGDTIVIPTHADCLIVYSSIEDHLSYRDRYGSWLIQALCQVLDEKHKELDILQMVTLVHRTVAYRDTYTPTNKAMHLKKQMTEARFTLTKFLKF